MRPLLARLVARSLLTTPLVAQDDMRPTVAVLPFVNGAIGAAGGELTPLSKGIADLLITDLRMNPGIRVVERATHMLARAVSAAARRAELHDIPGHERPTTLRRQ